LRTIIAVEINAWRQISSGVKRIQDCYCYCNCSCSICIAPF